MTSSIAWFRDLTREDIPTAGGKGANLGEMYNAKLPIPPGFVVTAQAYKLFLDKTNLGDDIYPIVKTLDVNASKPLQDASEKIQKLIVDAHMPEEIAADIREAYDMLNVDIDVYRALSQQRGNPLGMIKGGREKPYVAVRSSATAEDLPEASFAGQQATFLNVKGADEVVKAVQKCWASLFTARAIYYRTKNNFAHDKTWIAVIVQRMVNSDIAGVMFSVNPSTNNRDEIMIEAAFGLGEAVVGGEVTPDTYIVDKKTMQIKSKKIAKQTWGYFRQDGKNGNSKRTLTPEKGAKQKLNDDEIRRLAEFAVKIERHYGAPQDMEWAVEGIKMMIVQSRAVTTLLKKREESASFDGNAEKILSGLAASPGVGSGKVKILRGPEELEKVQKGDVLVTKMTSPDYVPAMQKAAAIVTDEGGMTSHAAIVSREMGIPCIVGSEKATELLHEDDLVTVDGTHGNVYRGAIQGLATPSEEEETISHEDVARLKTKTKIYMNLGEPEKVGEYKALPFDGIGLMRLEFIITSWIGKHPLAMIKAGESKIYVQKLAEGIRKVAQAIQPRPMIIRFSDFKTNEYRNLDGGEEFEPHEENPMIGWRGVSRYISPDFKEAFRLECRAIKILHNEGLGNVHVMLPFVRNVDEVQQALAIMKEEGLENKKGCQVYLMAEVPAIALIPEEFAQLDITGASIGSNDLTQGVLCVDRDSAKLGKMGYFDERNPAVLEAMKRIIQGFQKHGKTVGICGQAPSVYPEITKFLVEQKITSISVNPDVVEKTRQLVAKLEK